MGVTDCTVGTTVVFEGTWGTVIETTGTATVGTGVGRTGFEVDNGTAGLDIG